MHLSFSKKGFTLIEVMVVMAIIAILSTLIVAAVGIISQSARNTKRLSDMRNIQMGLDAYKTKNRRYPSAVGTGGCSGWESGFSGSSTFLSLLKTTGFDPVPVDPTAPANSCTGYRYYRYAAGSYGCTGGAYYVLGITKMEGVTRPHKDSPGWSCSSRNWQNEFDWVTGEYE